MGSRIFRPPSLGRLRLANVEDSPTIIDLMTESMAANFRIGNASDVVCLVENSVLSICLLDVDETIVGFLAARDHPVIPSVHPLAWEEYIWTKYKAVELNSRNTLFLHLLCWNSVYGREAVDSMLKSVFMHDPYVQHIAIVKSLARSQLLVPGQSRSEASFRKIQAMEKSVPGDQLPSLCIADRKEVSPRLRIRRAVEEDNDDIVPIIERQSTKLREMYGDFYISELISRHPESERILLVCESKELAVGVMCLNTQINFESLEESFELAPFSGLRRLTHPVVRVPNKASSFTESSQINVCGSDGSPLSRPDMRIYDPKSRVTWLYDDDDFKRFRSESFEDIPLNPLPQCPQTNIDILNMFEDEDELEFDIINIETDLLRVPELLTYNYIEGGPADCGNITKILDKRTTCSNSDKTKKDSCKSNKTSANHIVYKPPEPTRYTGVPNAFLIELFAMHEDYDERYGFDILEAAYEMFPDRDYCIICLPSHHSSFPLLEHFTLVTPVSNRMRFINETLYVAHVNSVKGELKVRPGEAFDLTPLMDVIEHSPRCTAISELFETSLTSYSLQGYVVLSQNQPVGMIVIGPLEDATAIRTQYDLEPEPRQPGSDGTILSGIVSPAMEPHNRWILRELLRQSRYATLFWMCKLFAKGDSQPSRNLISLAGHMTPVHPRHAVPNISGNKNLDKIFKDISTPFSLWIIERPLSSLPKVYVNNSIVVVGASRTGLAFLETLLLGPTSKYLTFSNITLISEHGLPTVSECLKAADTCVPKDGRYTDRYLKSVPFFFYLDIMTAVMIGIDRKKKCVVLKGGGVKFYDELVLTCGRQFQHPEYLRDPLELVKEVARGKPCDRMPMDNPKYLPHKVPLPPELPENVMVINSLYQANVCLRKLLYMINEYKESAYSLTAENPVIVYGECIEAYSCIAALLELGLSADMITFIEPFPPEESTKPRVNCFNNETVDERVQANLEKLGIRVLRKSYISGWHQHDAHVDALNLMCPLQAICEPCFALFYYGIKAIDIYAFNAINECGLVYDGGLVVGPTFDTNDPHVFGAGTCVKYSRRLRANLHAHRYYCSEDVGEALAKLFLMKLDPFVMGDANNKSSECIPRFSSSFVALKGGSHSSMSSATRLSIGVSKAKWQSVTKYESPIVQSATLPGPLYYMKVRKPGREMPMEVQMCLPHQGHTLITDKCGNYFRLHLNAFHCIDAVTCLSKKSFSSDALSLLYGSHEAFFNKLLKRFQMKLIEDLFDFFIQPWMSAIYQETFGNLLKDINEQEMGTVFDLVKSRFSTEESINSEMSRMSTCTTVPSCGFGPEDAKRLGTFRSVIDRFVAKTSSPHIMRSRKKADIPSECGQSAVIRGEASSFWSTVDGEQIVLTHLAKYLDRNNVANPHYANPKVDQNE